MKKVSRMALLLLLVAGAAGAALVNVTKANYVVSKVYSDRNALGVDLIQNGPKEVRTEIRLNDDARCYWVRGNGSKDVPMSVSTFMRSAKIGTRISVSGGRDWDGKINASTVWGQQR